MAFVYNSAALTKFFYLNSALPNYLNLSDSSIFDILILRYLDNIYIINVNLNLFFLNT